MTSGNDTGSPVIQWLSNGRYHVMVTSAGGGYSSWQHLALTRCREHATYEVTLVEPYEANSWGPADAARVMAGEGGWHDPAPDAAYAKEC